IFAYQGDLRPSTGAGGNQSQVHGYRVCGAHDDFVDHHHRHGGAGHGIDGHRTLVAGATDHYTLVGLDAGVVGIEVMHFLLGNADQHDGFVVFEHVGIDDGACRVEQDLHIDRLAGVGRHVGYVDALEGVAVHSADTIGQGAYLV